MIAKCLALLAVVAQINAYACNNNVASGYGISGVVGSGAVGSGIVGSGVVGSGIVGSGVVGSGIVGSGVVGSGIVGSGVVGSGIVGSGVVGSGVVGSGIVGSSGLVGTSGQIASSGVVGSSRVVGAVSGTGVASRNIVAKGKYPVALDNTGPIPDRRIPVSTSHVQAPVQEKPTVRLSARIPAPRIVAHSCTCYKQILRPRVHDQYITVPTVQRYIETTHTPVVENIHYEAVPVNCPSTYGNSGAVVGGQFSSASFPVASASQVAQVVPVSAAVESVSAGIEAAPVTSTLQAIPVSSVQMASSLPLRSLSTGCGNGFQGYN